MSIYHRFASIYQRGPYVRFSQKLAESVLPEYLALIDFHPVDLLDIACGEGSFAVAMAEQGYRVTGVDQSAEMIDLACDRAREAGVEVNFFVEDMRNLRYQGEFDLVTCLFDSMNYLLTVKDLQDAIHCAFDALRPGGYYIFDMNTIYGLAVDWMAERTYVQNEADDFIEYHQQEFDYENLVASMEITIFKQQGELWERIRETHRERGYPIADLQFLLTEAGYEIAGMYGSLSKRTELQTTSPRVFFIAKKPLSNP
jgi:2-polyprenyl-3-methyl-5-hydroxy-6-metoxy-1,4-benzoquinol methylase